MHFRSHSILMSQIAHARHRAGREVADTLDSWVHRVEPFMIAIANYSLSHG